MIYLGYSNWYKYRTPYWESMDGPVPCVAVTIIGPCAGDFATIYTGTTQTDTTQYWERQHAWTGPVDSPLSCSHRAALPVHPTVPPLAAHTSWRRWRPTFPTWQSIWAWPRGYCVECEVVRLLEARSRKRTSSLGRIVKTAAIARHQERTSRFAAFSDVQIQATGVRTTMIIVLPMCWLVVGPHILFHGYDDAPLPHCFQARFTIFTKVA
jgi:hypothetical protein